MTGAPPENEIAFADAVRVWIRVALLSFGGPAGQIAVMHRIVVEEKRWIGEARFLHALHFCMLLPGPEAQQLAIYLGWLLHGVRGGVVAGVLFVLPGFVAILALSLAYVAIGGLPPVEGALLGLKAAVLVVVLQAVTRIGRRALRSPAALLIAVAAFAAIFLFSVPFPAIVLAAGIVGYLAGRTGLGGFVPQVHGGAEDQVRPGATTGRPGPRTGRDTLRPAFVALVLWLGPVAALLLVLGPQDVFAQLGVFFSQMAVVTFGGAYAVLAYVAQAAVESYGWVRPEEMLDGLGFAETTPGPLIQVVQFVGFLAAHRDPGPFSPEVAGILASALVTWVTFTPSFLWIFLGAPHIERLRGHRALGAALASITAAVVGVILNLGLWFGLHVLFAELRPFRGGGLDLAVPVLGSLQPAAAALVAVAALLAFRFRLGVLPLLASAAALGAAWRLLAG